MKNFRFADPEALVVLSLAVCAPANVDATGARLRNQLLAKHPFRLGPVECRAFAGAEAISLLRYLKDQDTAGLAQALAVNPSHALVLGMLTIPSLPKGKAN